jgi:hypothetical protein
MFKWKINNTPKVDTGYTCLFNKCNSWLPFFAHMNLLKNRGIGSSPFHLKWRGSYSKDCLGCLYCSFIVSFVSFIPSPLKSVIQNLELFTRSSFINSFIYSFGFFSLPFSRELIRPTFSLYFSFCV